MHYIYYRAATSTVRVLQEPSEDDSQLLGSVGEEDFAKVPTNFLVHSLMRRHQITDAGVTIIITPATPST